MYSILFALALPLLAVALPGGGGSQCDTGAVQCCNQVQPAGAPTCSELLGSLGIVVPDLNTPIGIDCSPLDVIGVGSGASCTNSPVCCQNNTFNGVVAIGCTPININL